MSNVLSKIVGQWKCWGFLTSPDPQWLRLLFVALSLGWSSVSVIFIGIIWTISLLVDCWKWEDHWIGSNSFVISSISFCQISIQYIKLFEKSAKTQTNDHKSCFLNKCCFIRCCSKTTVSSRIFQFQIGYSNSTCTLSRSGAVDDRRSMLKAPSEAFHIINWFIIIIPSNPITVVFEDACQCDIRTFLWYYIFRTSDCDGTCMWYNEASTCTM